MSWFTRTYPNIVEKANPYHDASGRFTSPDKAIYTSIWGKPKDGERGSKPSGPKKPTREHDEVLTGAEDLADKLGMKGAKAMALSHYSGMYRIGVAAESLDSSALKSLKESGGLNGFNVERDFDTGLWVVAKNVKVKPTELRAPVPTRERQKVVVGRYTETDHFEVNGELRKQNSDYAKLSPRVAALDAAMVSYGKETTLYRGMTAGFFGSLSPADAIGKTFQDHAFASTSSSSSVAKNFVRGGWMMRVKTTRDTPAIDMKDYQGRYNEEKEVLLARGGLYRVTGVNTKSRTVDVVWEGASQYDAAQAQKAEAKFRSKDRFVVDAGDVVWVDS